MTMHGIFSILSSRLSVDITPGLPAKPLVEASAISHQGVWQLLVAYMPLEGCVHCVGHAVVSGMPLCRCASLVPKIICSFSFSFPFTKERLMRSHSARTDMQPSYMSRSSFDKTSGRSMRTL